MIDSKYDELELTSFIDLLFSSDVVQVVGGSIIKHTHLSYSG